MVKKTDPIYHWPHLSQFIMPYLYQHILVQAKKIIDKAVHAFFP